LRCRNADVRFWPKADVGHLGSSRSEAPGITAFLSSSLRIPNGKVHVDYHVDVDGHRYSVLHALVGQSLEARLTRGGVELLLRGQRVAAHARSDRRGGYTTVDAHMPAAHRAHREWTPQRG
jgi:hypothetical protein